MKTWIKLIVVFAVMAFCLPAFAGVTGEVIGKSLRPDGYIQIDTRFVDDKGTPTKADDEQIGTIDHRLWNPLQFKGRTLAQVRAIIVDDLQKKAKGNLILAYKKNSGTYPEGTVRKEKVQAVWNSLPQDVNIEVTQESLTGKFDTTGDDLCDESWTIYPDGTADRVSISPVPCS